MSTLWVLWYLNEIINVKCLTMVGIQLSSLSRNGNYYIWQKFTYTLIYNFQKSFKSILLEKYQNVNEMMYTNLSG